MREGLEVRKGELGRGGKRKGREAKEVTQGREGRK